MKSGWFAAGVFTLQFSACLYDADNPCGQNQELTAKVCVCVDGYGFDANGVCRPCGEGEVTLDSRCECEEGRTRSSAGACVFTGLRAECASAADCVDPSYPFCAESSYCTTSGCLVDADCPDFFRCDTAGPASFCRWQGYGDACESESDCTLDATFCETTNNACLVADCELGADTCGAALTCCDSSFLSAFGFPSTLCLPSDPGCCALSSSCGGE